MPLKRHQHNADSPTLPRRSTKPQQDSLEEPPVSKVGRATLYSPAHVQQLQRLIGNQATRRMLSGTIQRKPASVETKYLDSAPISESIFGMRVINDVKGDSEGLKGYLVAERIEEVHRDAPFKIAESRTSEHEFSATNEGEYRVDAHIMSPEGIDRDVLASSDKYTTFNYVLHQNFVYKQEGSSDETAVVVPNSGFKITNQLNYNWAEGDWVHSVIKTPEDVTVKGKAAKAGTGSASG